MPLNHCDQRLRKAPKAHIWRGNSWRLTDRRTHRLIGTEACFKVFLSEHYCLLLWRHGRSRLTFELWTNMSRSSLPAFWFLSVLSAKVFLANVASWNSSARLHFSRHDYWLLLKCAAVAWSWANKRHLFHTLLNAPTGSGSILDVDDACKIQQSKQKATHLARCFQSG